MSSTPPAEVTKANDPIGLGDVRDLVEPLVGAHGLSLYDIAWVSSPAGLILRVFIEREGSEGTDVGGVTSAAGVTSEGGVTLEDCVRVSRDLSTALDAAELIPHAYNLEVSSPGLDRPLKQPRDFARQLGRLAKLRLKEPARDGQTVLRGTLLEMVDDTVVIEVDGNRHEVSLDNIHQAKLVFELGGHKKKGQGKPKKGSSSRQRKRKGRRQESAGPKRMGS